MERIIPVLIPLGILGTVIFAVLREWRNTPSQHRRTRHGAVMGKTFASLNIGNKVVVLKE